MNLVLRPGSGMLTPHFTQREMGCRCRRPECDAAPMDRDFMRLLEDLRDHWGKPLVVTSGVRCSYWNNLKGGAPDSQHLLGKAADLDLQGRTEIEAVAQLAEKMGFGGIGRGEIRLLHVDTGPSGRRWRYHGK